MVDECALRIAIKLVGVNKIIYFAWIIYILLYILKFKIKNIILWIIKLKHFIDFII